MPPRVRRYLGATVLLFAAPLAFPSTPAMAVPVEVCNPTPRTDTSLCATYDVAVLAAGTETPTTSSQSPFDLRMSFANTSTGYLPDATRARWLTEVSTTLLSQGDRQPILTGSAQLPDKLLVAGASSNCAPGPDFSFSTCDAGHGVASVLVKQLTTVRTMKATFGVHRIYHDKPAASGHFAALTADISFCIDTNAGAMSCDRLQNHSQTVTIDTPAAGSPWTLPFRLPTPSGWGIGDSNEVQGVGIDSVALHVRGQSNQLRTGPAAGTFTWMKLPMRCGLADISGVAESQGGTSVTVPKGLTVTNCSQIKGVISPARLVSGQSGVISGTLVDFDTNEPMEGAEITLRTCSPSFTTPCAVTTHAQLTTAGGAFSFTVSPTANTNYFVRVPPVDGKPDQWVLRRVDVAPKVTIAASRTSIPSGATVTLSGSVKPAHDGEVVDIQRKLEGVWTTISSAVLSDASTYSQALVLTGSSGTKTKLRVVLPAHDDHAQGTSPKVVVEFR